MDLIQYPRTLFALEEMVNLSRCVVEEVILNNNELRLILVGDNGFGDRICISLVFSEVSLVSNNEVNLDDLVGNRIVSFNLSSFDGMILWTIHINNNRALNIGSKAITIGCEEIATANGFALWCYEKAKKLASSNDRRAAIQYLRSSIAFSDHNAARCLLEKMEAEDK